MFTALKDVQNSFDNYEAPISHTALPGEVEWINETIGFCTVQVIKAREAMDSYPGPRTEAAYAEALHHSRRNTLNDLCAALGMASTGEVLQDIDAVKRSIESKRRELKAFRDVNFGLLHSLNSQVSTQAWEVRSELRSNLVKFEEALKVMEYIRDVMNLPARQQFAAGSPFYMLHMAYRGAKEQHDLALAYKASIQDSK